MKSGASQIASQGTLEGVLPQVHQSPGQVVDQFEDSERGVMPKSCVFTTGGGEESRVKYIQTSQTDPAGEALPQRPALVSGCEAAQACPAKNPVKSEGNPR